MDAIGNAQPVKTNKIMSEAVNAEGKELDV